MDNGSIAMGLSGIAFAIATGSIGFAFNMAQRMTKAETKIDFIYDRVRVNIATAVHEPHEGAVAKDELIEKFVQKRIVLSEVRQLVALLEEERESTEDKKKSLRAENLLELVRWEFHL